MVEKEFNFIGEIRNNPRIVNESDLQKMEYIELSYTGELIPVEEVEGKFDEFTKKLKEEFRKEIKKIPPELNKEKMLNQVDFIMWGLIDKLGGDGE